MGGTCPGHDHTSCPNGQHPRGNGYGTYGGSLSASTATAEDDRPTSVVFEGWPRVLAALENTHTRDITLRSQDLPENYESAYRDLLVTTLQKHSTVRSVTFGDISAEWMRALSECLLSLPTVVELRFVGPRVDDRLARIIGAQLQSFWDKPLSLESLVVANSRKNVLTDRGALALVQPLEDNRSLRTLVLFGTFVGDSTARAVVAALSMNTSLEVLVLYGKAMGKRGLASFTHWVEQGKLTLKELVLGGSDFNDEDAEAFAHALTRRFSVEVNPRLKALSILNVLLGDSSAAAFADVIHSGLAEVNLLAGQVSCHGAQVLAQAVVQAGQALSTFSLASSTAGDTGLGAFKKAWSAGNPKRSLELAFGSSNIETCQSLMLQAGTTPGVTEATADPERRRLYATKGVPEFLEETLFPRLMLRGSRV